MYNNEMNNFADKVIYMQNAVVITLLTSLSQSCFLTKLIIIVQLPYRA